MGRIAKNAQDFSGRTGKTGADPGRQSPVVCPSGSLERAPESQSRAEARRRHYWHGVEKPSVLISRELITRDKGVKHPPPFVARKRIGPLGRAAPQFLAASVWARRIVRSWRGPGHRYLRAAPALHKRRRETPRECRPGSRQSRVCR